MHVDIRRKGFKMITGMNLSNKLSFGDIKVTMKPGSSFESTAKSILDKPIYQGPNGCYLAGIDNSGESEVVTIKATRRGISKTVHDVPHIERVIGQELFANIYVQAIEKVQPEAQ